MMKCEQFKLKNTHCTTIENILIIEDSISLSHLIKDEIDSYFSFNCDVATNEIEAKEMIRHKHYDLVIVDVFLPDSSGNFIGKLVRNNLRVIVMTGSESEELRSAILTMNIVDYVIKNDAHMLVDYLIKTIQRLKDNHTTVIGICDDSKFSRHLLSQLIESQNLPYYEFSNGQEAFECIVGQHLKIDVLLSDYEMPKMNGLELIRHIRNNFLPHELPIIAISASNRPHLTVQFLKTGANDYIKKPFENEELCTRVNLTLDQLYANRRNAVLLQELGKAATHDFLTQLYNRNFFFSQIQHIIADAVRQNKPYGILMIDIDHFKKINDIHGHHAGDVAIQHLAALLKKTARASDYCFRWGGEEFLILIPAVTSHELVLFAERLRRAVCESTITLKEEDLTFALTISIGGSIGLDEDSEMLISEADGMLYEAKVSGRNCIKISEKNNE